MRKFILASALAATLIPAAAMAQSYGEVRHDNREIQQDRRDLRDAQWRGDRHDARDARRDIRDDRQERREDWRDYRRAHPDIYRGGAYRGPRADWRYRPVAIGYRFDPVFYGRNYWIDAGRYHLRPVGADTRWVRYGNDVLLVNVRTGRVLEVNNGFFY
ncbi:RcnB family protein [Sphingomonas abietis]|uniref:RcnB family protein n=1 Tax=Sphingomonas abietis TaxID=3012344 RepID=A0ABY7NNG5_9SPHN|nr:RcnB family protein [Sphingomonas abietis]WBO22757.1 RcnB family protein [Sphingomonas abietis]